MSHLKTKGTDLLLVKSRERSNLTQDCILLIYSMKEISRRVTGIDCTAHDSFQPLTRIKKYMATRVDSPEIGFVVQTMRSGISKFLATLVTLRA